MLKYRVNNSHHNSLTTAVTITYIFNTYTKKMSETLNGLNNMDITVLLAMVSNTFNIKLFPFKLLN